jgi:hypothetical protein
MIRARRSRALTFAAVGVLLALATYISLNWLRIEQEPRWVQAGKEARRDPFLAFGRLVARMGGTPQALESPLALANLARGTTLFFAAHRLGYMSPRNVRAVREWVDQGGHLVLQAEATGTRDPLLDAFGIRREFFAPRKDADVKKSMLARLEPPARRFDWPGAARPLQVEMPFSTPLRDLQGRTPHAAVAFQSRVVMLSVAEGRGEVTVVPSFSFATNEKIGRLDHAQFAWLLASRGSAAPRVLMLLRFDRPHLTEWLWAEAWPVVVMLALFIVLWLIRVIPRFGPLAPDFAEERRSLAEHILASGRFLWSRGAGRYLVEAVRDRALRLARQRRLPAAEVPAVPGLLRAPHDFVAAIARLSTIEARLARRAARPGTVEDKKP